jgi:hypothetical protein
MYSFEVVEDWAPAGGAPAIKIDRTMNKRQYIKRS